MFAANTDFQPRPDLAAPLDADFDQFTNATLVDRHEWVDGEYAPRDVDT